jgi:hypothetical protein
MTTLERRIEQLEAGLTPAETAARWLAHIKATYHSITAYAAGVESGAVPPPHATLPRQITAWVRKTYPRESDASLAARTERAVRSVLMRVYLVDRVNSQIEWERYGDDLALELLRDLAPYVLGSQAPEERRLRWLQRVSGTFTDTVTWQRAGEDLARRYFAGQSPYFADAAEHLSAVVQECERLLHAHDQALRRKRRPLAGEPVDVGALRATADEGVESFLEDLVTRVQVQVFEATGGLSGERLLKLIEDKGGR